MSKIKIVTDSALDMTSDELQKMGITMVPLTVYVDGKTYLDSVEISAEEFLIKMDQSKEMPKTSQPPVGKFLEVYDELGKDGTQIISIHMTGGMSGTYQSAKQAAEMSTSDVTVVDSRYISRALSYQVLEAARMADAGNTVDEIVARLEEVRSETKLYIMVDTLENLIKGGRIGKAQGFIGSLLNIKPIANLDIGALSPVTKVRSHAKGIKFFVDQISEELKGRELVRFSICHAGRNSHEFSQNLSAKITEITGFKDIDICVTAPIISAHAGPGAVGIMYQAK
ncbi:DegV family protein [Domibacillus epiphyticus]|uniref:Fatty acid-binding protein DegV n=1 Tax=Domibacillus epiphyticus TaxID=1714355 RepID=A0A1V2A413_9BACI|nr:DegV family protein [Domibacillus epiphyticus]OMP65677.1 fatty acid-binding protein DegV [Domibacillus epiphyticus]